MCKTFEKTYPVGAGETDPSGLCRPSALQGFLQDAATIHAEELGIAREDMLEINGCFWILVRAWFSLNRPPAFGETVTIRTWHRGARGAQLYRDFDILAGNERVGEAVTAWVITDWETQHIVRPSRIPGLEKSRFDGAIREKTLGKLTPPETIALAGRREIVYSDLDINRHVNNVRYTDFVCNAIHLERLSGGWLRRLQVNFAAQSVAGEVLALFAGTYPDGQLYVSGRDGAGVVRFEAVCETAVLL